MIKIHEHFVSFNHAIVTSSKYIFIDVNIQMDRLTNLIVQRICREIVSSIEDEFNQ